METELTTISTRVTSAMHLVSQLIRACISATLLLPFATGSAWGAKPVEGPLIISASGIYIASSRKLNVTLVQECRQHGALAPKGDVLYACFNDARREVDELQVFAVQYDKYIESKRTFEQVPSGGRLRSWVIPSGRINSTAPLSVPTTKGAFEVYCITTSAEGDVFILSLWQSAPPAAVLPPPQYIIDVYRSPDLRKTRTIVIEQPIEGFAERARLSVSQSGRTLIIGDELQQIGVDLMLERQSWRDETETQSLRIIEQEVVTWRAACNESAMLVSVLRDENSGAISITSRDPSSGALCDHNYKVPQTEGQWAESIAFDALHPRVFCVTTGSQPAVTIIDLVNGVVVETVEVLPFLDTMEKHAFLEHQREREDQAIPSVIDVAWTRDRDVCVMRIADVRNDVIIQVSEKKRLCQ